MSDDMDDTAREFAQDLLVVLARERAALQPIMVQDAGAVLMKK
jgi:hypothetical protein